MASNTDPEHLIGFEIEIKPNVIFPALLCSIVLCGLHCTHQLVVVVVVVGFIQTDNLWFTEKRQINDRVYSLDLVN